MLHQGEEISGGFKTVEQVRRISSRYTKSRSPGCTISYQSEKSNDCARTDREENSLFEVPGQSFHGISCLLEYI